MAGRIAYYGNISPQGLVLNLDAAIVGSYPKTGSTWFDISNNGNNGTLTNGPTFTGSDFGAIVFDGTNDYVDCGTASPIPNSWTLSGWVNQRRITGTGVIIARSAGSPLSEQNAVLGWSSTLSNGYYIGGKLTNDTFYYQCTSSAFTNTGSILNIVGTFNQPTTTLTLYINGAPANTKNPGFSMITSGSQIQRVQVGCSDGNIPGNFFSGSIYQTQIYNQSLSPFQVWQNFNAYKSRYGIPDIVTDGLVLNLDAGNPYSYLSGSSGTTWSNTVAVSSSISGTLTNGPVYSNGAITFDGTNDYVDCGNSTSLQPSSITFGMWVRRTATWGSGNCLFWAKPNGAFDGNGFYVEPVSPGYSNSTLVIFNGWPNFIRLNIDGNTTFPLNTPVYFCFTLTGGVGAIYINGTPQSTTTTGTLSITNNTSAKYIMSNSPSYGTYTPGIIHNVQIYNRALSATEIQQNFNALRGRYGI